MAWGWGRAPVVLIPDEAAGRADGVDWVSVFVHELAHLGRRDHLAALFADVVAALLFWNPVVWLARRQLARASEFACDDRVVTAGKSPVDFAVTLLALRREALVPRVAAPALIGSRAGLKARVRRLLQVVDPPARLGPVWAVAAIGVAVLLVAGLAVARDAPRAPPGGVGRGTESPDGWLTGPRPCPCGTGRPTRPPTAHLLTHAGRPTAGLIGPHEGRPTASPRGLPSLTPFGGERPCDVSPTPASPSR